MSKQYSTRKRAVKAALGSVRAEGLKPSKKTKKILNNYAKGKITVSEMRSETRKQLNIAE